jgi:hypothetical protein
MSAALDEKDIPLRGLRHSPLSASLLPTDPQPDIAQPDDPRPESPYPRELVIHNDMLNSTSNSPIHPQIVICLFPAISAAAFAVLLTTAIHGGSGDVSSDSGVIGGQMRQWEAKLVDFSWNFGFS